MTKLLTLLILFGTSFWEVPVTLVHSVTRFLTGTCWSHSSDVYPADHPISIDLDIEGGSTAHFDVFVNRLRTLEAGGSKKYVSCKAHLLDTQYYLTDTISLRHRNVHSRMLF